MGQVCRKHEEFYEEACRWCEPDVIFEVPAAPPVPTSAQWGGNLNNQAAAQQNIASGSILCGGFVLPPRVRQPGSCACGVYVLGGPDAHVVDHHRIHHSIRQCVLVLP